MLKTSKEMTNAQVAELLRQVAAAFEVKDEDYFRVRAYQNAASSIEHASSDLHDLWEENKLSEIPGVGAAIKQHIDELFRTGRVKHFEAEVKGLPMGMFPLLALPGIGAKTAFKLAKTFKLNSEATALSKLEEAAKAGKIRKLAGFGDKSEEEILKALGEEAPEKRMLLPEALRLAELVMAYLRQEKAVEKVEVLGSLRRRVATIGDIDIAVATKKPKKVMEHLLSMIGIKKVLATGDKTTMFVHSLGRQVDVKTSPPAAWGSMLQHYTGSKLHNIKLRTYALERGMSLSEHGIKHQGKLHQFTTEKAFYEYLGLSVVPPELREDVGEIEAAGKGSLPALIGESDIRGDLHMHTQIEIASSHDVGRSSIGELLRAGMELGYEYLGFSDHNPKRELSEKQKVELLKRRREAIEEEVLSFEKSVKNRVPHVFVGLEVDIQADGGLALPEKGLELLDYAIASMHAGFDMGKQEATKRALAALEHPKVRIFGHPTGRKLMKRRGLDYDWDKIFDFCVKNNKWLEVNAAEDRMDLPDVLIREAVKGGVKLVIDTDSHWASQLKNIYLGVWNARRGWAEKKDVMNALPFRSFSQKLLGK